MELNKHILHFVKKFCNRCSDLRECNMRGIITRPPRRYVDVLSRWRYIFTRSYKREEINHRQYYKRCPWPRKRLLVSSIWQRAVHSKGFDQLYNLELLLHDTVSRPFTVRVPVALAASCLSRCLHLLLSRSISFFFSLSPLLLSRLHHTIL